MNEENLGDYKSIECPNCHRHRVFTSGICEKCNWDVNACEYSSVNDEEKCDNFSCLETIYEDIE